MGVFYATSKSDGMKGRAREERQRRYERDGREASEMRVRGEGEEGEEGEGKREQYNRKQRILRGIALFSIRVFRGNVQCRLLSFTQLTNSSVPS